jgi:hypothetical protein
MVDRIHQETESPEFQSPFCLLFVFARGAPIGRNKRRVSSVRVGSSRPFMDDAMNVMGPIHPEWTAFCEALAAETGRMAIETAR